jgi:hypothetical protein
MYSAALPRRRYRFSALNSVRSALGIQAATNLQQAKPSTGIATVNDRRRRPARRRWNALLGAVESSTSPNGAPIALSLVSLEAGE